MAKDFRLESIAAVVGWGALCGMIAVFATRGLIVSEGVATLGGWALFLGGIALRIRMRRGPLFDPARPVAEGLTTGEMTAQRLADMEARIYELEERLELAERLLAEARERPRLERVREDTPV